MTATKEQRARKLRMKAGEVAERALRMTKTMAALDAERMQLFAHAERLRMQAEELESEENRP